MRIYSNHIVLSRHLFLGLALALIVACPPVSRGGETPDSSQGARGAETNVFRGGSLKLVGTVAARDPGQRVAIIKDEEKGRQWIYREGDYAGKILIKRILHDRIIVDAGGGKALLKMTRSPSTGFGPSPPRYRPDDGNEQAVARSTNGLRDRHYVIERKQVAAIVSDPENQLGADDLGSGRLFNADSGFRINAIGSGSIFENMGLRSGDLVLRANGQEISGPEEAVSLFEALLDSEAVDLSVRRRARTYRIHLEVQ